MKASTRIQLAVLLATVLAVLAFVAATLAISAF
jgi:hypothetical protein